MKDIVLIEATSKSTYQRKYKCPYCEQKYERNKLHIHIQNKHENMIPEGYTALRVAFNVINNKTEGHCIMCGKVSDWNEDKGRYERLCNDPKCHEAYKRMAAERNKKKYGTERLQSDPRYAEEVQRKALQGRRIAGKYKFADGDEVEYLGAYERRFLEFMDKVMNCKSEDIAAPGPTIKYIWNGAEHLYISDFYYIPYNLIVEIKDGGDNPNNNPAMRGYKTDRQEAKEAAVKATGNYNYVRQTNNDFSQVMSIMAVLKYNLQNDCYDPIMRINEQSISESILFNEKDIYYNKNKFDSGEINLCFITGHSGSGKSTMARDMQKSNIEHYELDDLQCIKDHFTMENLKEYGDLIYSYFNGPGKKFYMTYQELVDKKIPGSEYEDKLFPGFVHYAMQYAKSHKDKKYVIEGVWLFCNDDNGSPWFKPEEFKDYAFYIKGTSMIVSKWRAAKRDAKEDYKDSRDQLRYSSKNFFFKNWKWYILDEKYINRFRTYFKKMSINEVTENMTGTIGSALAPTTKGSSIIKPLPAPVPFVSEPEHYMVVHPKDDLKLSYSITRDPLQYSMFSVDPQEKGFYKVFKTDKGKIKKPYLTFKIKDKQKAKELYESLSELYDRNLAFTEHGLRSDEQPDFVYSYLTDGSIIRTNDQVLFDNRFELVNGFIQSIKEMDFEIYCYLKGIGKYSNINILEQQIVELEGIVNE